jgi:hypothetical protein
MSGHDRNSLPTFAHSATVFLRTTSIAYLRSHHFKLHAILHNNSKVNGVLKSGWNQIIRELKVCDCDWWNASAITSEVHWYLFLLSFSLRNASCCVLVLYMSFIFLSNTTIYQLTHSHFTVRNWVYWAYNAATCFGSWSHLQVIH